MFGLAADGVKKAVSTITAPLRWINDAIVEPTAKYEMFLARLETTEKTAESAAKSFDWIKKFAAETPYRLDQVMDAFTRLRAFGIDPMDETMRKLGDTASTTGGASGESLMGIITAVGQAWSKTKLQTEEMNQLLERGVPAWDLLSRAMHKPIPELQDMASKGKLGRDAIRALIDEAGRTNSGGMERASQTFEGLTSTLADLWQQISVGIGQGGLLDQMKTSIRSINETLMSMNASGELPELTRELGGELAGAARTLVEVLPPVADSFRMLSRGIGIVRREVKLTIFFWDQLVAAVDRAWAQMVPVLNGIRSFENIFRDAFGGQHLAPYAMPELPSPPGGGGGPRRGGLRGGAGSDNVAGGSGADNLSLPAMGRPRFTSPFAVPGSGGASGGSAPVGQPVSGRIVVRFENAPDGMCIRELDAHGIDLAAQLGWVMR